MELHCGHPSGHQTRLRNTRLARTVSSNLRGQCIQLPTVEFEQWDEPQWVTEEWKAGEDAEADIY